VAVGKPIDANGVSCASSFPACLCPVDDDDSSSAKTKKYDIVLSSIYRIACDVRDTTMTTILNSNYILLNWFVFVL